jgi:hypothetical protein
MVRRRLAAPFRPLVLPRELGEVGNMHKVHGVLRVEFRGRRLRDNLDPASAHMDGKAPAAA